MLIRVEKMSELNIRDYICRELSSGMQEIAIEFVSYLENNNMTFIKDNGAYWKDKIYYWVKFNEKCVCFIEIKGGRDTNQWTVWSDDMGFECLADSEVKEIAWEHINHCKQCGSCSGGKSKMVFGKVFDDICGCTFRIDNPTSEDLPFMKEMVEIRIKEILNASR